MIIRRLSQRRRDRHLARTIEGHLRELLDLQDKNTTVELALDYGSALWKSMRDLKARPPTRPDPTPRLARRARAKRRNRR